MKPLVGHLLLALLWTALSGTLDGGNFATGMALGYGVLWLVSPVLPTADYVRRLARWVAFAGYYAVELVAANARVAYDVLTPTRHLQPAWVRLSLAARTDLERALVANLISMTPGSLSVDLDVKRNQLLVHVLSRTDASDAATGLKRLERRLLAVLR